MLILLAILILFIMIMIYIADSPNLRKFFYELAVESVKLLFFIFVLAMFFWSMATLFPDA